MRAHIGAHMSVSELRRLRRTEEVDRRLKQLAADLTLDKHVLTEATLKVLRQVPAAPQPASPPATVRPLLDCRFEDRDALARRDRSIFCRNGTEIRARFYVHMDGRTLTI